MKKRSVALGLFGIILLVLNFLPFYKYSVVNVENHTIAVKHYSMFYLSCVEYLNVSVVFLFVNLAFIGAALAVLGNAIAIMVDKDNTRFYTKTALYSGLLSTVLFLIILLFTFVVL